MLNLIDWKANRWIILNDEIYGYCECCMTLIYIYVPSRDDNCRLANRQLFVLVILFGLIRPGIIGQLIERSDLRLLRHFRAQPPLRLLRHLRAQPFPFCNGKQNWGSLSRDCQRGKLSPHYGEGHSVKSYSED